MSDVPVQKIYRPNVAAIVLNESGEILACHRSDMDGIWQLPQGGIKEGEDVKSALFRELNEEIGTSKVEIIWQLPDVLKYDWPEEKYWRGFHGQKQTYFLVRLKPGVVIDLKKGKKEPEFDAYEWVTVKEFAARLSGFKKDVYLQALQIVCDKYPDLIARTK